MKRIISVCLLLSLLLCLCSCAQTQEPEQTQTQEQQLTFEDPAKPLTKAIVENFPMAKDSMTKEQLRQLCLEFFKLQLSGQWKTDEDISFYTTYLEEGQQKHLTTDNLYGGVLYQSIGFGNIYRWMEYYDETTGIMPLSKALADNGGYGEGAEITHEETDEDGNLTYYKYRSMMALGNQCTSSSCWSWGRVINSVRFGDTCDLNAYNGYIPVGGYTYGYTHEGKEYSALDIEQFGVESESNPLAYDTPDVIKDWNKANGKDAMYECYALMKPGDCLVNQGHALMVKSVSVKRDKAGNIADVLSLVVVEEQIEAWGYEGDHNGQMLYQQGRIEKTYSFEMLQKQSYIPFTFVELLDENDPVDKSHLDYYRSVADKLVSQKAKYQTFDFTEEMWGEGVEKAVTYCTQTADSVTVEDFTKMVVGSNYSISDVFVTVTDDSGKELLKNIYRADFTDHREVPMTAQRSTWEKDAEGNYLTISDGLEELTGNTVTVSMQLCTGELLTAYTGTISG